MKYLKYVALLGVLVLLPLTYAQAAVSFGVGIGVAPGYVAGAPACLYGYYPDYPYACAPYGYYDSDWFVGGVFIGAGPWYHGWGHPYYGRPFYGRGYYGRAPIGGRGFEGRRSDGHGPVATSHSGGSRGGGRR